MTSLNLNYFLRDPTLNTGTQWGRTSVEKFGEPQTFSPLHCSIGFILSNLLWVHFCDIRQFQYEFKISFKKVNCVWKEESLALFSVIFLILCYIHRTKQILGGSANIC